MVKNFGLLSTQFLRFDGCKIWVPNETLMSCDIINVTHSRNLKDRLTFQVDVRAMHPDLCEDLAQRVMDMQEREEHRRLFNNGFQPASYILGVTDPLKYTVQCPWFFVIPVCCCTAASWSSLRPERCSL